MYIDISNVHRFQLQKSRHPLINYFDHFDNLYRICTWVEFDKTTNNMAAIFFFKAIQPYLIITHNSIGPIEPTVTSRLLVNHLSFNIITMRHT